MASPSPREQRDIVQVLDTYTSMMSRLQVEMNKQSRLKTALMQDLLTGKVRVTPLLTEAEVDA